MRFREPFQRKCASEHGGERQCEPQKSVHHLRKAFELEQHSGGISLLNDVIRQFQVRELLNVERSQDRVVEKCGERTVENVVEQNWKRGSHKSRAELHN